MSTFFGDKRIALEPIPKDATAVVVRVETWEKMESALTALRAENVKLREALEKIRAHCETAGWDADVARIDTAVAAYDSTSATAKEVERVRAMERVIGASELVRLHRTDSVTNFIPSTTSEYVVVHAGAIAKLLEALAAYEQLIKEKP